MPKKVPIRKCVGCQERKEKRELIRIVRSPEGEFSVDPTGKKPGRGAYICPKLECLEKAIKNKGLERSFKTAVDDELKELLRQKVTSYEK
ncbi:nucleic acid-binding protein [Anoxybacter fermentans]|uniref:Nucleic acid-binding protein n=1 Tax=Anoxybacter fermentans TaxID=1323375 RepID=A0A3S9SVS0_9FIRM|nr:YlxR family protein [Anoxybacter fermentans]AZR72391.1 nucleic acid-binding protein [Anoxybacter fermentans]